MRGLFGFERVHTHANTHCYAWVIRFPMTLIPMPIHIAMRGPFGFDRVHTHANTPRTKAWTDVEDLRFQAVWNLLCVVLCLSRTHIWKNVGA